MKRLAFSFFTFSFLLSVLIFRPQGFARAADLKPTVGIGILLDVEKRETAGFIRRLETEITNLLKARYTVKVGKTDILRCDWSVDCIQQNYKKLVADADIDIIIAVGPLNGAVLTRQKSFSKPLIIVGVIDPALQKIPITAEKTSGVHNLTYLMVPRSLEADLDAFYRLYPYKRIALIEDHRLLNILPPDTHPAVILAKKGLAMAEVAVDAMDRAVADLPDDVDAVLIGSLYRFENEQRADLIGQINHKRLPSFAMMGAGDLKRGALAATQPETDLPRIFRRLALNIERILDGEDPATLPVTFERQKSLYVNMDTARRIGFSPSWDTIMEAELVHSEGPAKGLKIGLREAIGEALAANRALAAKKRAYRSKEMDVALAKTELFPRVGLSVNAAVIDEPHAAAGQAERATSTTASLDQVVFSEQRLANVTIERHALAASRHSLSQAELDTVQASGVAYFDILKAATNRRIRKDYLGLVKKNLDVARKRLSVGYAGAADVYRWESEVANAKNSLIEAHVAVLGAKQRLNQLLFRPIDGVIEVSDVSLTDNIFNIYPEADFRKYLNNPASMKIFTDFLATESRAALPEIKELDASIKAKERALLSQKRKRYLPDVSLHTQADRSIGRSGTGSAVPLPDKDAWQVGVNATWPIFQGGGIQTRTRQLAIDIDRLKTERADRVHALELTLRNNVLDIVSKSFNIELAKQAAEAGAKSLDLVQDSYEKGLASLVQLLDAQNTALAAELAAAGAVYDYFSSYLNLERSQGRFIILSPKRVQTDFFSRFISYYNEARSKRAE